MNNICIAVFNSSSNSIHMFKILKDQRLKVELMSTPCTIASSCSRAIKFSLNDLERVIKVIEEYKINIKGIYERVYSGNRFFYKKVY
ncbi:DUF3343 domain-containing protein [Clostridium niameyense]|uniref:DUF3343 domain-containing protein n=1 Tax=Clostridium niameyense TaxID=1622073 RepID=UPI00067EE4AF|nr:DUF3343 domain-containing protein [Clostridium niameyense]